MLTSFINRRSKNSPLPPLPPPAMAQTQAPPPSYHDSVLLRQQQSLPSLPPAPPLPPRSQTLPRVRSPVAPPPPARNARTVGYQYAGATPSNIDMGPSFPSTPVMIEHGHGNRLPAAAYAKDLPLLECAPGKHDYVTKYGVRCTFGYLSRRPSEFRMLTILTVALFLYP